VEATVQYDSPTIEVNGPTSVRTIVVESHSESVETSPGSTEHVVTGDACPLLSHLLSALPVR